MSNFFQKKNKNDDAFFQALKTACEVLIYISETDAPVLAFAGSKVDVVTAETILQQTGAKAGVPVDEITFDIFFARLTTIKDWFGERETAMAEKFLELQKLLEENLREIKVFRIGKIQVAIYAVGINKDGRLMGVTTQAVET